MEKKEKTKQKEIFFVTHSITIFFYFPNVFVPNDVKEINVVYWMIMFCIFSVYVN